MSAFETAGIIHVSSLPVAMTMAFMKHSETVSGPLWPVVTPVVVYSGVGCLQEKLSLHCVSNSAVQELMRCIRSQMDSLLTGLPQSELSAMSLGLAHRSAQ